MEASNPKVFWYSELVNTPHNSTNITEGDYICVGSNLFVYRGVRDELPNGISAPLGFRSKSEDSTSPDEHKTIIEGFSKNKGTLMVDILMLLKTKFPVEMQEMGDWDMDFLTLTLTTGIPYILRFWATLSRDQLIGIMEKRTSDFRTKASPELVANVFGDVLDTKIPEVR